MNEERDFVVFTDDDGNDFELDVIDYFDYNDKEYAVLVDTNEECDCEDEECDCETNVYIMQVVVNEAEDTEEFVSPAEEDMDALIQIVQSRLEEGDCCCDDDCCCDECTDDCTCDDSCAGDNASAKCGTCGGFDFAVNTKSKHRLSPLNDLSPNEEDF